MYICEYEVEHDSNAVPSAISDQCDQFISNINICMYMYMSH